jgi:hypothetical protein
MADLPSIAGARVISGNRAPRLLLGRLRHFDTPELLCAGSHSHAPTLGTANGILAERFPIGSGD